MKSPITHIQTTDWVVVAVRALVAAVVVLVTIGVKFMFDISWSRLGSTILVGVCLLLAIAIGLRGGPKQQTSAPSRPAAMPSTGRSTLRPSEIDTQPIPVATGRQADAEPQPVMPQGITAPIVFHRHWKMAFRNAAVPVVVCSIVLTMIGALLVNAAPIPPQLSVNPGYLVLTILALVLGIVYVIAREKYRANNSLIIVEEHCVVIKNPDKRTLLFRGGTLDIPMDIQITVKIKPRTWMEFLFFRNVQTVTIDTPTQKDFLAHNLTDVINPNDLANAIVMRKSIR